MPRVRKGDIAAGGESAWPLTAGHYECELCGSGSVHFGMAQSNDAPPRPKDFTHMIIGAILTLPGGRAKIPAALSVVATPTMDSHPPAGMLFSHGPTVLISCDIRPEFFSDIVRAAEAGRLKKISFTLGEKSGYGWPIQSWGIATEFGRETTER